ncbi:alpha/beta hydrolase [Schumannella sp. 10F1B-5-1]|uniref:alpha/beta hydrolase n=1 Tax=Schumannella sp. 10F1B-5-1 TaxID=2590780 RepID=UPI001130978C|nr:alpha/beta hydrolase [Schumannella sp. 10F1B-5-1]TPW76936.1 alpha/beta hydrolase [Schumannella sp. 10F1B-5-1]
MRLNSRAVRASGVVATVVTALMLVAGCTPTGDDAEVNTPPTRPAFPGFATDPDVPVVADQIYGTAQDGTQLKLDVCLPPTGYDTKDGQTLPEGADGSAADADADADDSASPTADPSTGPTPTAAGDVPQPAIVMVHGGSWARGDKAEITWRSLCQWLAKAGYVVANVDYRLAPQHTFPAAIDDVQQAVRWMRLDAQQKRFRIDPKRIGAFGGSAGGNLVSLLGTKGSGPTDENARVSAVVELSGPIDLTGVAVTPDFVPVQLAYLGCASEEDCPAAKEASATSYIDATDPPFFVAHSIRERIPLEQANRFVTKLRAKGVDTTFVKVKGALHSIAMLADNDPLRARIVEFFDTKLRDAPPAAEPVAPAPGDDTADDGTVVEPGAGAGQG